MIAGRLFCGLFLALMVGSGAYADKDDTQFVPGKLVYVQHNKTTIYTTYNSSYVPIYASKTKTFAVVVKVGETYYTGEGEKGGRLSDRLARGISGVGSFNEKDWKKMDTDDVLVSFEKKGIGWQAIAMTVKQPNGKQIKIYLKSIVGPDGKEQCGKKTGCTGHNWDQVPHTSAAASAAPAQ
jgi:hypothetical protein